MIKNLRAIFLRYIHFLSKTTFKSLMQLANTIQRHYIEIHKFNKINKQFTGGFIQRKSSIIYTAAFITIVRFHVEAILMQIRKFLLLFSNGLFKCLNFNEKVVENKNVQMFYYLSKIRNRVNLKSGIRIHHTAFFASFYTN